MSLKSTQNQLERLLVDQDNKVIALSGKWGTGKSFMWNEVKKSSADKKVNGALYVSLFGLSGVDQVKMKLIQSAMPALDAKPALWKSVKQTVNSSIKVLEGFHKGFAALNDLGLVLAPGMLRQKLIVLDDIERKHEKLNIDEVLGFIDEFTQQHESRFVLILNSDQLDNKETWNKLREKVIDQELRLNTSESEAFEIAIELTPSIYAARIRTTVEACGLTNIRIVRRVIKAVNLILGNRHDLTDAVLSRLVPSTVLLCAIHYKGIDDGPDFEFILSSATQRDWGSLSKKQDIDSEDSKRKSRWNLLMTKLGILGCDEYELLVIEFLQSGLFDVSTVTEIIDRYAEETDIMNALDACKKFFERELWDHELTEAQLLRLAAEVADSSHLLDPYTVTSLSERLLELPDGKPIADAAVNKWVKAFTAKGLEEIDSNDLFQRKLHPQIQTAFNAINSNAQAKTSAYDACLYLAKNSGWGERQEIAMKAASIQEMEEAIRKSPSLEKQQFMVKMVELCINNETYEKCFGAAMDNFVEACKNIVNDPESARLGKLVKVLFANSKFTAVLESSQVAHQP
jgi:hypothetical protein